MNNAYIVRIDPENKKEIPVITKEQIKEFRKDLAKYEKGEDYKKK